MYLAACLFVCVFFHRISLRRSWWNTAMVLVFWALSVCIGNDTKSHKRIIIKYYGVIKSAPKINHWNFGELIWIINLAAMFAGYQHYNCGLSFFKIIDRFWSTCSCLLSTVVYKLSCYKFWLVPDAISIALFIVADFCLSNAIHSIGESIKSPGCPCVRAPNFS